MILKRSKMVGMALAVVLALAACGDTSTSGGGRPLIVVSTTVWGDIVSQLVADDATVEVLMPVGADPHDFRPSARQAASLVEADLVIINGLGLEEGLADVVDALPAERIVELGPLLDPIAVGDTFDPHVWLDPERVMTAVDILARRFADLEGASDELQLRADGYRVDLAELMDFLAAQLLDGVPPERRLLVTQHDSLRYLAAAFDYDIVGTLIEGGSTLSQPSSQHLADIVGLIEERSIPAIFVDSGAATPIADSVADGRASIVELYVGALNGTGADTYVGMMKQNGIRIAEALNG